MSAALLPRMPNTTSPSPSFEAIDLDALINVQGGCGGKQQKQCCTCAPQAIAIAAAAPAPAPAPLAPAPAPAPMSDSISTSVSVSYQ